MSQDQDGAYWPEGHDLLRALLSDSPASARRSGEGEVYRKLQQT